MDAEKMLEKATKQIKRLIHLYKVEQEQRKKVEKENESLQERITRLKDLRNQETKSWVDVWAESDADIERMYEYYLEKDKERDRKRKVN